MTWKGAGGVGAYKDVSHEAGMNVLVYTPLEDQTNWNPSINAYRENVAIKFKIAYDGPLSPGTVSGSVDKRWRQTAISHIHHSSGPLMYMNSSTTYEPDGTGDPLYHAIFSTRNVGGSTYNYYPGSTANDWFNARTQSLSFTTWTWNSSLSRWESEATLPQPSNPFQENMGAWGHGYGLGLPQESVCAAGEAFAYWQYRLTSPVGNPSF